MLDLLLYKLQLTSGCARRWSDHPRHMRRGFLGIQTPILFKPTPEGRGTCRSEPSPQWLVLRAPKPAILKQLDDHRVFDALPVAICFRTRICAPPVQDHHLTSDELPRPRCALLLMEYISPRLARMRRGRIPPVAADDRRRSTVARSDDPTRVRVDSRRDGAHPARSSASSRVPTVRFLRVPRSFSARSSARSRSLRGPRAKLAYLVRDEVASCARR